MDRGSADSAVEEAASEEDLAEAEAEAPVEEERVGRDHSLQNSDNGITAPLLLPHLEVIHSLLYNPAT